MLPSRSPLAGLILFLLCLVLAVLPAHAFKIQEVRSPGGITAWLVEDHAIPLIAMNFSFRPGSILDPAGKTGATNFLSGMLDEGAEDLDSASFQKRRDDLAFRQSFSAGHDYFEGSFQTLTRNRDESFDLLRKAITTPRFEVEPLERVRKQILLGIQGKSDDPQSIAYRAWMELAVPGDAYAADNDGSESTIMAIGADDLQAAHKRIFTRSTLQIGVVGDINAKELGVMLDKTFGALPEGQAAPLPDVTTYAPGPRDKVIARDIPQSVIIFGHEGIKRSDPDFIPAYVMTEILGGGGFGSRLTHEVREKRGLTYGVGANLSPMERFGFYVGSLSTRNESAGEALQLIKDVMKDMAENGPTQQELDDAKTYLTGSYALRFTGSESIAGQLLGLQQQGFGPEYVETRNAMVEAVTLDQVKAQAKRLLHPDRLIVTVVGKPVGLD